MGTKIKGLLKVQQDNPNPSWVRGNQTKLLEDMTTNTINRLKSVESQFDALFEDDRDKGSPVSDHCFFDFKRTLINLQELREKIRENDRDKRLNAQDVANLLGVVFDGLFIEPQLAQPIEALQKDLWGLDALSFDIQATKSVQDLTQALHDFQDKILGEDDQDDQD